MKHCWWIFGITTALCSTSLHAQHDAISPNIDLTPDDQAQNPEDVVDARRRIIADLAASPEDSDLLRRLAMLEAGAGHFDLALAYIEHATNQAPNDLDVALARAFILYWRGDVESARQAAASISAQDPDYPELGQLESALRRRDSPGASEPVTLYVSAGASHIITASNTQRTWTSQNLAASIARRGGYILTLSAEREDRGPIDTRIGVRLDRLVEGGFIYLAAATTPDPDFKDSWSVSTGADLAVSDRVAIPFDLRVAQYAVGTIIAVQPGLRVLPYPGLALTARAINIFGDTSGHRFGGAVRADYETGGGLALFLATASYPDAESDGIRQLRSIAAGTGLRLTDTAGLRLAGSYENRDRSYRRYSGVLTLTYRFAR